MGRTLITEADRQRTPPLPGSRAPRHGGGQRVSRERGTATRNKKNPGKRTRQGG